MASLHPVTNWMTDFDHSDPRWVEDPFPLWNEMRLEGGLAQTERHGGVYFPLSWDEIRRAATTPDAFSSRYVVIRADQPPPGNFAPPITCDPPHHRPARARLSPAFSQARIAGLEGEARAACRSLLAGFAAGCMVDAVVDYAQPVVSAVLGTIFGLAAADILSFQVWPVEQRHAFVHRVLADKRAAPKDDLMSNLIREADADTPADAARLPGSIFLLLIAGLDTTASVITAALRHLAENAGDQAHLRQHRDQIPSAVEEFLRAFAPVSSGRVVQAGATLSGCPVEAGRMVLLSFAAANRDPSRFADADRVVIDRPTAGRHAAFGFGPHTCVAARLARMLITVALDEWLAAVAAFDRDETGTLAWSSDPHWLRALGRLPLRLRETQG